MPQGDKKIRAGARLRAASKPYDKDAKKTNNSRKGGPVKAPKSATAKSSQSTAFSSALPSMIKNFEQMAAGRVLTTGGKLGLNDLKVAGRTEMREQRKSMAHAKAVKKAAAGSLKGLTKKDLVEEAEIEYLSSLTGQNLK